MKIWSVLFFGQLISLIGTHMTGFSLGLKVYEAEQSVTLFALISFATLMPEIILGAFMGTLVDRWNRRTALIVGNLGAGCGTLIIVYLNSTNQLEIFHIFIIVSISSSFNSLVLPAFMAATSTLVPKEKISKANGLLQLGLSITQIIAPASAAALLVAWQLNGVLLVDVISFSFVLCILFLTRIPNHKITKSLADKKSSLLFELKAGWEYLKKRKGLVWLLGFTSLVNFNIGMANVLFVPLILSFTDRVQLGLILTIAGVGMLTGAIIISLWDGLEKKIIMIMSFLFLQGLLFSCALMPPSFLLVSTIAFMVMFTVPIISASNQIIWQRKVAPEIQGRIFGLRLTIGKIFLPIAVLISGPLADNVFEPLMADNAFLANSVGIFMGTGPGRGIALQLALIGILTMLLVIFAWLQPALRNVENDLQDY